MMMGEYGSEPVAGLPGPLPAGERLLWQGKPDWKALALRAYRVRAVTVYFALLVAWRVLASLHDGAGLADALVAGAWLLPLWLGAVGILGVLAFFGARATVYSVTSRRLVIRSGIALPMAVNLPFKLVDNAAVKLFRDGTGDIPVHLSGKDRVSYLLLWPHVRPWRLASPEPSLRAVPEGAKVAELVAKALVSAAAAQPAAAEEAKPAAAPVAAAPRPVPQGALLGGAGA